MNKVVERATLGETEQDVVAKLGDPTYSGTWSGSYGEGTYVAYCCPYVWEGPVALAHEVLTERSGYCQNWSPSVQLEFDSDGTLAEVTWHSFASKSHLVVKSSRDRTNP